MVANFFKGLAVVALIAYIVFGAVYNITHWAGCDGDYVKAYTWNGATCIEHK